MIYASIHTHDAMDPNWIQILTSPASTKSKITNQYANLSTFEVVNLGWI